MTSVITYIPHGTIPDWRGFSPAIVGENLGTQLKFFSNSFVCANEIYSGSQSNSESLGLIRRIGPSPTYSRIFTKWTRLNPLPLEARLAKICNISKPSIVHAHQLEFPVNSFLRRLSYRPKIVVHAHAVHLFDPSLGEADLYLPVSHFTRQQLIENGYPASKTKVLYNGVDTAKFSPPEPPDRANLLKRIGVSIPENTIVIGFVGRKEVDKGYLDFLLSIKTLQDEGFPVVGLSAGPTPPSALKHKQWIHQEALRQSLVDTNDGRLRLIDMPAIPHKKVNSVFKLIDFFLFPSRFIGEQHPLALIEAMGCGCLVITSPIASVCETVTHNCDGIILPSDWSTETLLGSLRELVNSPQLAKQLRGRALTRALDFDWSRVATQLESDYFSLVNP